MKLAPTRWLLGGLLIASLALKLPSLAADTLVNAALLRVAAAQPCDPAEYICRYTPKETWYPPEPLPANEATLRGALAGFRQATQLAPADRRAALHEAEMLLALGDADGAAATLTEAGWPATADPDLGTSTLAWPLGSPLLTVGRYEHYLLRAHQHAEAGRWPEAVNDYRLALGYAGERATAQDARDFFLATANAHAAQPEHAVARLLAGKYFALAGEWQQAVTILEPLLAKGDTRLAAKDQAWAAYYLGRAYEQGGEPVAALHAYTAGWQASTEVRGNAIQLIALLSTADPAQAAAIAQTLEAGGPAYPAGRSGQGYRFDAPATLPSGWVFAGYDLDPESVGQGGPLEAWLWWRPPVGAVLPADPSLVTVGGYVLQKQALVNLVLNNSFEWGEQANGVPVGWAWRIYSEEPESLYIAPATRDGHETQTAVADNSGWPSSGVLGLPAPVETEGWYLMAGDYLTRHAPNVQFGRACEGPDFVAGGPYYPPTPTAAPPDEVWVHLADLAPAFAGDSPQQCRLILINLENPGGTILWDDLLLARVVPPSQ